MSERKPRLYLDTCIVSGMAKLDLLPQEIESIEKLLETYDAGEIELVTSGIAKQEIEKVPEEFQAKHRIIYLLLSKVPVAPRKEWGLQKNGVKSTITKEWGHKRMGSSLLLTHGR